MAAGYLDGGMKPIDMRIKEQICLFVWKLETFADPILAGVFAAVRRNDLHDAWNKQVTECMEEIGINALRGTKCSLKSTLLEHAVANALAMKRDWSFYLESGGQCTGLGYQATSTIKAQ